MPSPFPGMDPYLEDPPRWAGVHAGLIAHACAALNAVLPPGYAAEIGERVWVMKPERSIYPDVSVVRPSRSERAKPGTGGSQAVADPAWVVTVEAAEVRETYLDIVAVGQDAKIITTIEVLSPGNKTPGSEGRELYLRKQEAAVSDSQLAGDSHLIEIDLLRQGEHAVAAPRTGLPEKGHASYIVSLHRARQAGRFEVWPVALRDRLPRIAVPLSEDDPDAVLHLQEVFDRVYDEGPYRRRVDYSRPAPLPLDPEDAAWAGGLLRAAGLRPAGT